MTFRQKLIFSNLLLIILPVMFAVLVFRGVVGMYGVLPSLSQRLQTLGLLLALLALLALVTLSIAVTVAVMRSLMRTVGALKRAVSRIHDGELNVRQEYTVRDEFTEVFEALDLMCERLSESLRQREQAEQRKSEMIALISHDLKTPITSIRGYVQGLLDGVADTPEKTRRYLNIIRDKADDLNRLAEDLFLYSKLDAGPPVRELTGIDLGVYMDELLDEFENVRIERGYTGGVYPARLDTGLFARVVRNIVENSIKYAGRADCTVRADIKRRDSKLILTLWDNGPGVKDEKRIFKSFYREDAARTNPGSGSGLGLSVARQIVEAHGGKIWARVPPEGGLRISIALPERVDGEK